MKAVFIFSSQRVGNIGKMIIQGSRNIGLPIILQGKLRCDIITQSTGEAQCFLAYFSHNGPGKVVITGTAYKLILAPPEIGIVAADTEIESIDRLKVDGKTQLMIPYRVFGAPCIEYTQVGIDLFTVITIQVHIVH